MSVVRIDEDKVGFTRDSEEFRVNTARLSHFAAALGVTSGALAEGSVAHPVFAHVPVMQSMAEALRAAVPGFAFHGEHDLHCHAQIRPGQRLRTVSEVQGMRQTRAGAALVLRSSLRDAEGRLVVLVSEAETRGISWCELQAYLVLPESEGGLGVRDAMNLDGGSSSQLWVRGAIEIPGRAAPTYIIAAPKPRTR